MQTNVISPKTIKRILICKSRDLSYGSSGFFLWQISMELQKRGIQVEYFDLKKDLSNIDHLEQYAGHTYDAVLDINSWLPQMMMEDDTRLIDHIHAPFFNYIVDHPMHLPDICSCAADQYYMICLDDTHRQYIQQYYPQIQKCFVLPLAGSVPKVCKPYRERSRHIFFPGTYMPLVEYTAKLKKISLECYAMAEEYIRQYMENPAVPEMPAWYRLQTAGSSLTAKQMTNLCCYTDRYLRETIRHRVIDAILAEGYQIDVTGEHWEYYDGKYSDRLVIHPSCDYSTMLEQIGDSRIVLNVQPLFPHAPHDRVLCGMAGGAVVLTDPCSFLSEQLEAGRQYLCYDPRKPEQSVRRLRKYLNRPELLEEIAARGQCWVSDRYLWSNWVDAFLDLATSF